VIFYPVYLQISIKIEIKNSDFISDITIFMQHIFSHTLDKQKYISTIALCSYGL